MDSWDSVRDGGSVHRRGDWGDALVVLRDRRWGVYFFRCWVRAGTVVVRDGSLYGIHYDDDEEFEDIFLDLQLEHLPPQATGLF